MAFATWGIFVAFPLLQSHPVLVLCILAAASLVEHEELSHL
jgi:hypothetical protein